MAAWCDHVLLVGVRRSQQLEEGRDNFGPSKVVNLAVEHEHGHVHSWEKRQRIGLWQEPEKQTRNIKNGRPDPRLDSQGRRRERSTPTMAVQAERARVE